VVVDVVVDVPEPDPLVPESPVVVEGLVVVGVERSFWVVVLVVVVLEDGTVVVVAGERVVVELARGTVVVVVDVLSLWIDAPGMTLGVVVVVVGSVRPEEWTRRLSGSRCDR
jgi:hypothetical protein